MSTYIYLECRSHDPVLGDDGEIGQHLGYELENARRLLRDRDRLLQVMADMRATDVWDPYDVDDRYCARTLRFMDQHPTCDIGIRDEYGKDHPITPEEA